MKRQTDPYDTFTTWPWRSKQKHKTKNIICIETNCPIFRFENKLSWGAKRKSSLQIRIWKCGNKINGLLLWYRWYHISVSFVTSIYCRNSQSIKIGIDLSIDKSIKIGKSDLIDIDCNDQSVEIDDTLVPFIDLSRFSRFHRFLLEDTFCSYPKMKTDFMKRVNLLTTELQSGVEGSNNLLSLFKKKSLKKPYLFFKTYPL